MSSAKTTQFLKKQRERGKARATQRDRDRAAADAILADLFPEQRAFILDPYTTKSLLCPRRAGKTHTAISYACYTALMFPDCVVPLLTLTLKSAKKLYWDPLQKFNDKYALGMDIRIGDSAVVFPNGSKIYLGGAETIGDADRFRGGSYKLAIVDECAAIREDVFEYLIDEALGPACGDASGTLALTGTPGDALYGMFYEATYPGLIDESDGFLMTRDFYQPEDFWNNPPKFEGQPLMPGWSRHHWTVKANVFKPEIWENALIKKRKRKWSDDNPKWVREYLGQWVSTADAMVYATANLISLDGQRDACRCLWTKKAGPRTNKWGLPCEYGDDWEFVLGADLGFNDHFAIVVMAYSRTHHELYHVYEFKKDHLIVPQMAAAVKRAYDYFDGRVIAMVADTGGLGKLVVETLNQQYGFAIEPAEKAEKFDHIALFNSDLHEGFIKILLGSELLQEQLELQWDFRGLDRQKAIRLRKLREDPEKDNHLCDAALYTWRFCYHHYGRAPEPITEPGTPEWFEEWDNAEALAEHNKNVLDPRLQPEYTSVALQDLMAANRLFN